MLSSWDGCFLAGKCLKKRMDFMRRHEAFAHACARQTGRQRVMTENLVATERGEARHSVAALRVSRLAGTPSGHYCTFCGCVFAHLPVEDCASCCLCSTVKFHKRKFSQVIVGRSGEMCSMCRLPRWAQAVVQHGRSASNCLIL